MVGCVVCEKMHVYLIDDKFSLKLNILTGFALASSRSRVEERKGAASHRLSHHPNVPGKEECSGSKNLAR